MGKSSKKITTGYWYKLSVLLGCCHGPVDSFNRIAIGGRVAWSGPVTSNTSVNIDKKKLFGGEKREGGVYGTVRFMFGGADQTAPGLLASKRGSNSPAYRGISSVFFEDFAWSANNPYFKPPVIAVTRRLKGWKSDIVWYPAKCAINSYDMNPAHIIYECMTNTEWGMGYGESDIDASITGSSFKTAADTLYTEGFGLSIPWMQQSSIEDFVRVIIDHIGAAIQFDVDTGKFTLNLIRGGYDLDDPDQALPVSTANAKLLSFQRAAWGETANEIVVVHKNRDGQDVSIAVQDPANIAIQGAVISVTKQYPGIPTADLAGRVAQRDLLAASSPLAKIEFEINRSGAKLKAGDIINFSWPPIGVEQAAYRVISVNRGSLLDGTIKVSAVEDVFGLDTQSYMGAEAPGGWTSPAADPVDIGATYALVREATYYELERTLSDADFDYVQPDEGFVVGFASYPDYTSYGYSFAHDILPGAHAVDAAGIEWEEAGAGDYATTAQLIGALTVGAETGGVITVPVDNVREFTALQDCVNQLAMLGTSELVWITAVNTAVTPNTISFERGAVDTLPATSHPDNTVLWMNIESDLAFDLTKRVAGEIGYYKFLPQTRNGFLDEADTARHTITGASRKDRPYPPGQIKIGISGGALQYYPSALPAGDIQITWAHKNRLTQTANAPTFATGSVTVEPGTTYTVEVLGSNTYPVTGAVDHTETGITGTSFTFTAAEELAAGGPYTYLRFKVKAVRDGYDSHTTYDWTIQRVADVGLGDSLGIYLGGI